MEAVYGEAAKKNELECGRRADTAKVQSLARKPISNLQAKRRHARLVRRSGMTSESRVPYLFRLRSIFLFFHHMLIPWEKRHCTALHCTALHCTPLHCTALHCRTAPHRTASLQLLPFRARFIGKSSPVHFKGEPDVHDLASFRNLTRKAQKRVSWKGTPNLRRAQ